jgi:hypothetical protein
MIAGREPAGRRVCTFRFALAAADAFAAPRSPRFSRARAHQKQTNKSKTTVLPPIFSQSVR